MFTGIVAGMGRVAAVETVEGICRLTVDLGSHADGLLNGASVANNGACLTVAEVDGSNVRFDVIAETMQRTNLGALSVGDPINIERSLRFGDELGGHVLSGHVSGTAAVSKIIVEGDNRTMWFDVDAALMPYLLWKGWVAIDGASLTISSVDRDGHRIAVSLIPETLERTTLGRASIGDAVNIEIDAHTQAIVHTVRDLFSDPDFRAQLLAADSAVQGPGAQPTADSAGQRQSG